MLEITPAKKEDLKQCEALGRFKEFREASGDFINARFLGNYLSKDFFLVAKVEKRVIGYLVAEKLLAKGTVIWYFAVKKEYRDQGIGDKLIKQLEQNCKKHKIAWIYLNAIQNKKTFHFYRREGYDEGIKEREFIKLLGVKRFKDIKF